MKIANNLNGYQDNCVGVLQRKQILSVYYNQNMLSVTNSVHVLFVCVLQRKHVFQFFEFLKILIDSKK
jgi:hypothetical protein